MQTGIRKFLVLHSAKGKTTTTQNIQFPDRSSIVNGHDGHATHKIERSRLPSSLLYSLSGCTVNITFIYHNIWSLSLCVCNV